MMNVYMLGQVKMQDQKIQDMNLKDRDENEKLDKNNYTTALCIAIKPKHIRCEVLFILCRCPFKTSFNIYFLKCYL